MAKRDDLNTPESMTAETSRVHAIVCRVLREHGLTYTGGCTTFHTPESWLARGEAYGLRSALVVVYDGGDVRDAFEPYGPDCSAYEAMQAALKAEGYYAECCTGWYSAVYRI